MVIASILLLFPQVEGVAPGVLYALAAVLFTIMEIKEWFSIGTYIMRINSAYIITIMGYIAFFIAGICLVVDSGS